MTISTTATDPVTWTDRELSLTVVAAAQEKQAEDIVIIDVGDVLAICSDFVVLTARNRRQLKAIAEEIELHVAVTYGVRPRLVEGLSAGEWVLIDFGGVVVHIFDQEHREFYNIERLYRDCERQHIDDTPPPADN